MGETRNDSSRLFAAIRQVQDDQLRLDDGHERARARARLLQSIDASGAPSRALAKPQPSAASLSWRWMMGGLVAAACTVAVIFSLPSDPEQPLPGTEQVLSYAIDGSGEFGPDHTVIAGDVTRVLDFDDSTRIELAADSELRVADLRSNGATVLLAHGEVELSVHHEDDTSWQVAAGPWSVHVTGTQFSVAWNPTTEHFRVAVIEGSVRVEGPEGDVAKLRAGESLVRERAESSEVASLDLIVPPSEDEIVDTEAPAEAVPAPADPHPIKHVKVEAPVDWQTLAKDSKYAEAWAALEEGKSGVLGEAERVDAKAMLDLADVARFTEHRGDAKKVLERLRERFADSVQAGDAAFELGRIAADGGNDDLAASWFETYLDERPNGSLVNDALVRLMNAYDSLGRGDDAASAATRYLARQPDGTYAAKARKILGK